MIFRANVRVTINGSRARLCFAITYMYSRTSTGNAQSTQCTFTNESITICIYYTSANVNISRGQAAAKMEIIFQNIRDVSRIPRLL